MQIPTKHQDLNRETGTEPYFTNQVFEEEEIQGYQGLEIDIVLDTAEYIPRLFHKHSFKAEKRADDCVSLISTHFTEGLPTAPAECAAMHVRFLSDVLCKALLNHAYGLVSCPRHNSKWSNHGLPTGKFNRIDAPAPYV